MFRRGRGRPRPIGRLHGRSAELDAVDAEQAADGTRRGGDELVEPGVPIGTALPRAASRPVIRSCRGRRDSMAGGRLVSVGGRSRARTGSGAAVTGVIALDLGARDMSRLGRGILRSPHRGRKRTTTDPIGDRSSDDERGRPPDERSRRNGRRRSGDLHRERGIERSHHRGRAGREAWSWRIPGLRSCEEASGRRDGRTRNTSGA